MNSLTYKYILLLSSGLENFKKKGDNLFNFRCTICGDSQRNRNKARAYIYDSAGDTWFKCHKCGFNTHFEQYLRNQDYSLYSEYIKEKLTSSPRKKNIIIKEEIKPQIEYDTHYFNDLYSISKLPSFDPMKKYIINRKIPTFAHDLMFKCMEFKTFTNKIIPGKFSEKSLFFDEERLIIPFFTEKRKVFAFTGRTIDPKNNLRYVNINLDDSVPKLYGMERWNKSKLTYVVEGPIDSLFLENSLATAGNDMTSALRGFSKENFVLVYDNEKRSPTTREKIKKGIDEGYKVCIWPLLSSLQKDINSMILSGYKPEEIKKIIDENTFVGLQAYAKLALTVF